MDFSSLSNDELKALQKQTTNDIAKYHNMQLAKKILLNSAYGSMSNQWFWFYSDVMAESITLSGQLSIRFIARKLNDYLNNTLKTVDVDYIIAIDTDSNYITLNPLVKKLLPNAPVEKIVDWVDKVCREIIEPLIDKSYGELADMMNAYDQKMQMKREAIVEKAIWTGKKRYAMNVWDLEGVRFKEAELKVTGLSMVSSSIPYICRGYLKEAIKIIMNKSEPELWAYVEECRKEFYTKRFHEIGKPTGISDMEKYADKNKIYVKGTPIHVRAALLHNFHTKKHGLDKKFPPIHSGDKIKLCYLKVPNIIYENVFGVVQYLPEELGLERYIDYEKQFEVTFLTPLRIILDVIGWSTEQQVNIFAFLTKGNT